MKKDYLITYYRPMLAKTFESALSQFVTREFPFLKSTIIITLFVREVAKLVETYYPPTSYLRPGQMLWIGVDKDDRPGYTTSIAKARIKPVVMP